MAQSFADVDKWGIDPLTVYDFEDVDRSDSVKITISAAFEGNSQMVSFKQYGTNAYWKYILIANGLVHDSELLAGMQIRIPIKRPQAAIKKFKRTTI